MADMIAPRAFLPAKSLGCHAPFKLRQGVLQRLPVTRNPSHIRQTKEGCTKCLAGSRSGAETLIKICGVTCPEDAQLAVDQGADFVGMIIWPKAKRSVTTDIAMEIANIAKRSGAEPVGVFVDEDAETIVRKCQESGIKTAQLHGDGARAALDQLPESLDVIYVLNANPQGEIQTSLPPSIAGRQESSRPVSWMLVDGLKGGSGETFDWTKLHVTGNWASKGWLLAGGLGPENVREAISIARPTAVDVSSGVCGPDGLRKDPMKLVAFVKAIREAT